MISKALLGVVMLEAAVWSVLQNGVLGLAALLGGVAIIWKTAVLPGWRAVRNLAGLVREVHAVVLGDEQHEGLRERLVKGDRHMGRIEGKLTKLDGRLKRTEGALDVLSDQETSQIRSALARHDRRETPTDRRIA